MSEVPIEGRIIEPSIDAGSNWNPPANYEATLTFVRETPEEGTKELQRMYRTMMLGRGWPPYEYTPQQELKDRLNAWARGTYPGLPINWRGL